MSVKKSDVIRAVIVRTVKVLRRESGMAIKFDENAAVLINLDGSPKGSVWLNYIYFLCVFLLLSCKKFKT